MSKTKKVFKWLFIIAVIIGLIVALAIYATSGLTDTVNQQLSALRQGDIKKAYSYTSKSFQEHTSLAQFTGFVKKYPGLENNQSASFNNREINNGIGILKGELTAKNGGVIPIQYQLVKEEDQWKILSIKLDKVGIVESKKSDPADTTASKNQDPSKTLSLAQSYTSPHFAYRIKYPEAWAVKDPKSNTVIIYNKNNVKDAFATLNVQTLLSKAKGGRYPTVIAAIDDLKSQLKTAGQFKQLAAGDISLDGPNNSKLKGKYFVASYQYHGRDITQAQFAVKSENGHLFYLIGLTGTSKDFEKNKATMKAMLHSWHQYKPIQAP